MTGPPVWVSELAERFWADAGDAPPFPRDLESPAAFAVPVTVIPVARLRVGHVFDHLRRAGLPADFNVADRPLRATLYCWTGFGRIFLDPTDPPPERRFSIAHELAHFLRDYDAPRRQVAKALGPAALQVLDGLRPPTADERISAILRNRPLAPHCHLMSREADGHPRGDDERRAEADADRLACELLAPATLFQGETDLTVVEHRLTAEFGLPTSIASRYARLLIPPPGSPYSLIARLKKSS
ncbi:MAG: ImmA/IrrE family metallo-endopeptidase [Fimbriiglobus sp.]|jgi:hypothetical protein|nr:ImmA/IrrE family metallo-endopeptidase [Fimbriiglobus sp.]